MKTFENVFAHSDQRYDITQVDVDSFAGVPDDLIKKAHAVCSWSNKLLLVHHPQWDVYGLPGGTREAGETIEQSLGREILEETNCQVTRFRPLCYHKVVGANGDTHYRLNYLCDIQPIGEFKTDPAGNIDRIIWIAPHEYPKYIEKKPYKLAVMERTLELLNGSR